MLDPRNIIRTNKRTLSLLVNARGELIVRAPYNFPEHRIFDFVREKREWIEKKQSQVRSNGFINQNVLNYSVYLFLGKELTPVISTEVKNFYIEEGKLFIPAKIQQNKILSKLERWYKKVAFEVIVERTEHLAKKLRLRPVSININNNKTRWGVCNSKSNIFVNWRAIFLPPDLLDYIIIHELCHLLEFNHTKAFWAIVEQVMPNYSGIRKHLKYLNYLLLLFRKE